MERKKRISRSIPTTWKWRLQRESSFHSAFFAHKPTFCAVPTGRMDRVHRFQQILHFRVNTANMICQVLNHVGALGHSTPSGQPKYGCNDSGKGKKKSLSGTLRPTLSKSSTMNQSQFSL